MHGLRRRFPRAILQWEDLKRDNAFRLLHDDLRAAALAGDVAHLRHAVLDEIRLDGRFPDLLAQGRDLRRRAAESPLAARPPAGPSTSLLLERIAGGGDLGGVSRERERLFYAFDSGDDLDAWLWRMHLAGTG